jgi:hypothetical protein
MKAVTSTNLSAYEWMKTEVVEKISNAIVEENFCAHGGICRLVMDGGSMIPTCDCEGTDYIGDKCENDTSSIDKPPARFLQAAVGGSLLV